MTYILATKYERLLRINRQHEKRAHSQASDRPTEISFSTSEETTARLKDLFQQGKLSENEIALVLKARRGITFTEADVEEISQSPHLKEWLQTPQISSEPFTSKDVETYCVSLLTHADYALKYGAANCDGYAAVTLRNLIKSLMAGEIQKDTIKNIAICSIDVAHVFIVINLPPQNNQKRFSVPVTNIENGDAIVVDPYEDFILPFSQAIHIWKSKEYQYGKVACHALIENVPAFCKETAIKQKLKKLDESASDKIRHAAADELERLCTRNFGVNTESTKAQSHNRKK